MGRKWRYICYHYYLLRVWYYCNVRNSIERWWCKKFGHQGGVWLKVVDNEPELPNFQVRFCMRCGEVEQRTILDKVED